LWRRKYYRRSQNITLLYYYKEISKKKDISFLTECVLTAVQIEGQINKKVTRYWRRGDGSGKMEDSLERGKREKKRKKGIGVHKKLLKRTGDR
jgi:hypothetical protein